MSFFDPFTTDFFLRAVAGGALVAIICGIVGTWVVIRGMAFLGEALGHGMLPGVAIATVLGLPVLLGGAASALVMSAVIGALQRRGRLSHDTSIGLLFVAMLSLGVIVVSHSRSFATDATALLFGDILAIGASDLAMLAAAVLVTVAASVTFHRAFVTTTFDPRIAHSLGLRPRVAHVALVGLVTVAVVASYQAVGTLLVVGLLLGPAVAARAWTTRIATTMVCAALIGIVAVAGGLLASWHLGTAAGASIAAAAILLAALSSALRWLCTRTLRGARVSAGAAAVALVLTACAPGSPPAEPTATSASGDGHGAIAGAAEVAEPPLGLVSIDTDGGVGILDLLSGETADLGAIGAPADLSSDGRFVFVTTGSGVDIVDSGRWSWNHGDHFHYYVAEPRLVGAVTGTGPATVTWGMLSTAGSTGIRFERSGDAVLLDNASLAKGEVVETFRLPSNAGASLIAPFDKGALVGFEDELVVYTAAGEPTDAVVPCVEPGGAVTTVVGLAIGCADGAVLVTGGSDVPTFERVPYPEDAAARVTAFDGRKGRPTVAGLVGEDAAGFWLLDTRDRAWQWVGTSTPLVRVTAVDDPDGHVVGLDAAGRLHVYTAEAGDEVAVTDPLVGEVTNAVSLTVDGQRAYLSNPTAGEVYEIDVADGARIARTLQTPTAPDFLAEVGR